MNIDKNIKKMLGKKTNIVFNMKKSQIGVGMSSIGLNINKMLGKKLNFPKMSSKSSKNDWDGDGIPNRKDCQPRNIMRQDWIYPENYNKKYKKVDMPVQQLYHMRAKHFLTRQNLITPTYYSKENEGIIQQLKEDHKNEEFYEPTTKEIMQIKVENEQKRLEEKGYKPTPAKIKKDEIFDYVGSFHYTANQKRHNQDIKEIMTPIHSTRNDDIETFPKKKPQKKVDEYFLKMRKDIQSPEPKVPALEIENEQLEKGRIYQGRHRILAAKEEGLKTIPVFVKGQVGASAKNQEEWRQMQQAERNRQRQILPDKDGDRVPDKYDCDPNNTMKQDSKPNPLLKQKIDELPIFIVDTNVVNKNKFSPSKHITEKMITKEGVQRQKNIYGTFKRYPGLISKTKNTNADITMTNTNHSDFADDTSGNAGIVPTYENNNYDSSEIFMYPGNHSKKYRGFLLGHELKHAEQFKNMNTNEYNKISDNRYKTPWEFREEEIEADESGYKTLEKHNAPIKVPKVIWKDDIERRKQKDPTILKKLTTEEIKEENKRILEQQWKNMPEEERNKARKMYPDLDGDRVPDKYDCQPRNIMRQDSYWKRRTSTPDRSLPYGWGKYIKKKKEDEIEAGLNNFFKDPPFVLIKEKVRKKELAEMQQQESINSMNRRFPVDDAEDDSYKYDSQGNKLNKKFWRKPKNLKLRTQKGFEDKDGDGVINLMDCNPNNKNEQDFSLEADVPFADSPESFGYKGETVQMTPDEYMKGAWASHGYDKSGFKTVPEYEKANIFPNNLIRIKEGLQSENKVVPVPYLETKKGEYVDQEGRHRAVAARELGYETIPVKVIETDKNYIFDQELNSILNKYEQNPRGDSQGECHNAVSDIAKVFLKYHRSSPYNMQVYQIQTAGPDGKPSNHVVLKVGNMFYDPTGKQYAHIHGGNHQTRTTTLPSYYKVFKVIDVQPYL